MTSDKDGKYTGNRNSDAKAVAAAIQTLGFVVHSASKNGNKFPFNIKFDFDGGTKTTNFIVECTATTDEELEHCNEVGISLQDSGICGCSSTGSGTRCECVCKD